MYILIFLIILSVLVFIHELGHFLFAKFAGVKVQEFGFGYPPRALKMGQFRDTEITLNWIPFGGFVKILGENYDTSPPTPLLVKERGEKHFADVNKVWQVVILAAGVTFNILLAVLLFSSTFLIGTAYPADGEFGSQIENSQIMITSVLHGYPAEASGLKAGDIIENRENDTALISESIANSSGPISLQIKRDNATLTKELTPVQNPATGKFMIGIGMNKVGTLKLPFWQSLKQGVIMTYEILIGTIVGMWGLLTGAFRGTANLSQVAGPVGIVTLVGDAYKLGLVYLLSFTAFISINLAVVNLLPFPALDGGRILVVLIESLKGSPVNPRVFNTINSVGFVLLTLLMAVVTFHDIVKLF